MRRALYRADRHQGFRGGAGVQIGGVMRVNLVTGSPEHTAAEAIRTMVDAGVGAVGVADATGRVCIVTERDVLRLAGRGADFAAIRLRDVMTPNPLTISADDGILAAAQLMGQRKLRPLPV